MSKTSVLVMAFGSPEPTPASAAEFLAQVIGRPPSTEHVADILRRIALIGGSPLTAITQLQATKIAAELAAREGSTEFQIETAMRHGDPPPERVLAHLPDNSRLLVFPLSPQNSADRNRYLERVELAAGRLGRTWKIDVVPAFGLDPRFIDVLAARLHRVLESVPVGSPIVFTAHSLPQALPQSYQYSTEIAATAEALAHVCKLADDQWTVAFQSVPQATRQPWLGPNLNEVVTQLAMRGSAGEPVVVISPVQFLSDHMEISYDIDITARDIATARGCRLVRPELPNADSDLIALCGDLIVERAESTCVSAGSS